MPSITGDDQCSKDYSPHMWIGDDFISGTGKSLEIGEWTYYFGRTAEERLVAERYLTASDFCSRTIDIVPDDQIPAKVREAISSTAFADRQEEVSRIERMFKSKD